MSLIAQQISFKSNLNFCLLSTLEHSIDFAKFLLIFSPLFNLPPSLSTQVCSKFDLFSIFTGKFHQTFNFLSSGYFNFLVLAIFATFLGPTSLFLSLTFILGSHL